jgi:hypothetical protein
MIADTVQFCEVKNKFYKKLSQDGSSIKEETQFDIIEDICKMVWNISYKSKNGRNIFDANVFWSNFQGIIDKHIGQQASYILEDVGVETMKFFVMAVRTAS